MSNLLLYKNITQQRNVQKRMAAFLERQLESNHYCLMKEILYRN